MSPRAVLAVASALTLPIAGHIPAAPSRAALTNPPGHAVQGQGFAVPAIKHGGPVRYYLSRDTRRGDDDVRLIGPRKGRVTVPATRAGTYRLLACAAGKCAASRGQVLVSGSP